MQFFDVVAEFLECLCIFPSCLLRNWNIMYKQRCMCDEHTLMVFRTSRRFPTAVFSTGTWRTPTILSATLTLFKSLLKALSEVSSLWDCPMAWEGDAVSEVAIGWETVAVWEGVMVCESIVVCESAVGWGAAVGWVAATGWDATVGCGSAVGWEGTVSWEVAVGWESGRRLLFRLVIFAANVFTFVQRVITFAQNLLNIFMMASGWDGDTLTCCCIHFKLYY